jgi:hypothetical protein
MSIVDILKKLPATMSAKDILFAAEQIEVIKRDLDVLAAKIIKLNKEYRASMNKLEEQVSKVQNGCKHWTTTYHGDPSGGSDSCDTCDICGKVFGRREYRRS